MRFSWGCEQGGWVAEGDVVRCWLGRCSKGGSVPEVTCSEQQVCMFARRVLYRLVVMARAAAV